MLVAGVNMEINDKRLDQMCTTKYVNGLMESFCAQTETHLKPTILEQYIKNKNDLNKKIEPLNNNCYEEDIKSIAVDSNRNRINAKSGLFKEVEFDDLLPTDNQNNSSENVQETEKLAWYQFQTKLKWGNIIAITILHLLGVYGLYNYLFACKILTIVWGFIYGGINGFGVTGGAHRLFCHRSYKAKTPLRILLMLCYTSSGQNTLFDWVRDHRVHHKFSETHADPHNANRGFFFAHVGWLMMEKRPEVIQKGKQMDMSDILNDPVVQFHQKYFLELKLLLCFILPTLVPVFCWNETWTIAFFSQAVCRYLFCLNATWSVNSAAHIFGHKPYDKRISPSENIVVSLAAMGEGWHNYHHTFPWDYKTSEFGTYFNVTTFYLHLFAKIGWAYDLKVPSDDLIRKTAVKKGDGTHPVWGQHNELKSND